MRRPLVAVPVVLVERPLLALLLTLPLRPRLAYLPYPSCPVPAAGPFLEDFSTLSDGVAFSRGERSLREKRPKRLEDVVELALVGLGSFFERPELERVVDATTSLFLEVSRYATKQPWDLEKVTSTMWKLLVGYDWRLLWLHSGDSSLVQRQG